MAVERPRLPLGDYYQLLVKKGLLTAGSPLAVELTRPVTAVVCDSRQAVPGCLFLCKGAEFKEAYLSEALGRGAFAYVSETPYPGQPAPCIQVRDARKAMGWLADLAWGHPSGRAQTIGITGTKGKTTTAYFLKAILDAWRAAQGLHPVGLLSSIVTDDGVGRRPASLTTPEPLDLQRHLFNAAGAGCGYVVMECSSQALKYDRMIGTELLAAVFLNFGEDHISPREHPTKEDYFQSKLKIFDTARVGIVNLDGERAGEALAAAGRRGTTLTFAKNGQTASIFAKTSKKIDKGVAFTARYRGDWADLTIPLAGSFNLSNALAALCVCQYLEVPVEFVKAGLAGCRVPGRMETYEKDGKTVLVDYAHNAMALEALLKAVRGDYPGAEVTVVFGCVGGKALDRRSGMGRAAGTWADRVILTEDDPAGEDVTAICREVGRYVAEAGKTFEIVPDREEAAARAIGEAGPGAVVVLAGKGAETTQKRARGPEPCVPDALLARKYLGLPLAEEG